MWLINWLFSPDHSALVGGLGLILSGIGFPLTVWGIRLTYLQAERAEGAAQASQKAVENFKVRTRRNNAARDVTEAISAIETTRTHLANDAWRDASNSYENARRALIRLQAGTASVRASLQDDYQAILQHMSAFCDAVDAAIADKGDLPDKAKVLSVIRENYRIMISIRSDLEQEI